MEERTRIKKRENSDIHNRLFGTNLEDNRDDFKSIGIPQN